MERQTRLGGPLPYASMTMSVEIGHELGKNEFIKIKNPEKTIKAHLKAIEAGKREPDEDHR